MVKKNFVRGLALLLTLVLSLSTVSMGSAIAYADASSSQSAVASLSIQQRVIPTGNHKASVVLTLNSPKAYSSADFTVAIEGSATLESIESMLPASAQFVGPVFKDQAYSFGFFSTSNQFEGTKQVAVLHLALTGDKPVKLTLKGLSTTAVGKAAGEVTKTPATAGATLELTRSAAASSDPGNPNPPGNNGSNGNNGTPGTGGNPNNGNKPVKPEDLVTLDGDQVALGELFVSFVDIQSSWAMAYIHSLASFGLIKGKSDKLFAPKDALTRAEFIQLLINVFDENSPLDPKSLAAAKAKMKFKDVPAKAYYIDALARAYSLKIVGDSTGKFLPNAKLTRQEMMVMLYNAMRAKDYKFTKRANLESFKDYKQISSYARTPIAELIGAGVIEGSGGLINPLGILKREEAAKVIYEFRNQQ